MRRLRHIAAALSAALALAGCIGGGDDVCISPVPTPNACPNGKGGETAADMDAGSTSGGGEPAYGADAASGPGSADAFPGEADTSKWDPNAGAMDGDGSQGADASGTAETGDGSDTECGDAESDGGCGADATEHDGGDAMEPNDDALQEDAE